MNVVNQFGPGITETIEQSKQKQEDRENETKTKLEKEKLSLEFSNEIKVDVQEKLGYVDENLANQKEKESIISKLEAVYVNNKSKGLEFNQDQEVLKIIDTSSFESAGEPSDYDSFSEYNKKVKEIREEIKEQYINSQENTENQKQNNSEIDNINPSEDLTGNQDTENLNQNEETKEDIKQTIQNVEASLENKNILELPVLKGLHDNEKINSETYLNILKNLSLTPNKKINKIIDSLEIQNPETKEELDRVFNETSPQKNKENFNKTIKEFQIEGTEELLDVINNKSNDSIYEEIHELIATNYFEVENQTENPENNIKIAIETAGNKVLDKYPSIKKMSDTQAYKNAFTDIKSGNIKAGIEGIKNLLLLGSTIAFAGKKLNKEHIKKAKNLIESKYKQRIQKIEEDIQKLNQEIQENKSKQKENLEKINNLEKEKKEIITGELFKKAGKIDKSSEKQEKRQD